VNEIVKTPDSRPLVHSLSPEGVSSRQAQSFLIACPSLGIVIQFSCQSSSCPFKGLSLLGGSSIILCFSHETFHRFNAHSISNHSQRVKGVP
jgi:hypothetical protein